MTKPLEEKKYLSYLKLVKWRLDKSGFDYNLNDEEGHYLCTIKVIHGKGKKREVSSLSVRKTEKEFKQRGWLWPPKKK
jgi:hypothetical protein